MGIEPTRHSCHRILSPMRLPVPPRPQILEVPSGFEPEITELQSIALPLGHGTIPRYCLFNIHHLLQEC